MSEYLKYVLFLLLGMFFLFYINIQFDKTINEVKKDFDHNEIETLAELAKNITKIVKSAVKERPLYETLQNEKNTRETLQRVLEVLVSSKYKYAYVVKRKKDEKFRILLDGALENKSHFNEPFFAINEAWQRIYTTKEATFFKEGDLESIWMTYLYPIIIDGKVDALLAIDFSYKSISDTLDYFEPIQSFINDVLGVFGMMVIMFLIISIQQWYIKNRESIKHKKALRENEAFFKAILDSQSNMVVSIMDNKILNANISFLDYFKVDSVEDFLKKYDSLISEIEFLDKSVSGMNLNEIFNLTDSLKVKIYSSVFSLTGKNITHQNEMITIVVLSDITSLERATNKAKSASIAKSEFLASMSHEIRTPMNAILGLTDLTLKSELTNRQRDYLTKIKSSATSLLTIINDILDFSKIEAGKMTLEKSSFRVFDLINKIRQIFETQTRYKSLKFEIFIDSKLPSCFISDMVRIEQIVINLLGNAFKFTKNGGVELYLNFLENSEDYNLEIIVKDTGIGIESDKLSTLFDSFTQADSSITRKYGGTGLGLSISKQLVELLGGKIWAESEVDVGSNFYIHLNLELDYECKTLPIDTHDEDIMNKLLLYRDVDILVVEDNLINQDVICGYLEKFNFKITIVNNGLEAINRYENSDFDLIFMDINMPVMGGYESTIELRKIDKNIPIVALSANARGEDYQHSIEIGMDEHISKPIEPKLLYEVLYKYLPKEKFFNKLSIKKSLETTENSVNYDALKSLNSEKTLKEFVNNHKLYRKILERFFNDYKSIEKIDNLLQVDALDDNNEIIEYFHKLKSTSGAIGARELFDLVQKFYNALQHEKLESELIEPIKVNLKTVVDEIGLFLEQFEKEKIEDSNIELSNADDVKKSFDEVKEALKSNNFKKIKSAMENLNQLSLNNEDSNLKLKIQQYTKEYNFAGAINCF